MFADLTNIRAETTGIQKFSIVPYFRNEFCRRGGKFACAPSKITRENTPPPKDRASTNYQSQFAIAQFHQVITKSIAIKLTKIIQY